MKSLRHLVQIALAGIFLLACNLPAAAEDLMLPSGWRMPTTSELSDDWRVKYLHRQAVVEGDFNGDGITDQSMLLISERGYGLGLFAFLSQKGHTFKVYKLDEIKDTSILQVMGIAKVSPGRYKTACGKGYWDCKKSEPSELSIKYDAIDFFKVESANSYFYWDKKRKFFKRIWISD